jgi:hypothetical protein
MAEPSGIVLVLLFQKLVLRKLSESAYAPIGLARILPIQANRGSGTDASLLR